ncbi:coil containing protein [Vibrio phage 1.090.B._10N.286.48.F1]|nr:coil containing protein [Vibrio phage 1.090.B._10N.286.48.F1]
MLNLPIQIKNEIQVMSSVDLAKLCVGETKNAHSHFVEKAKKVLGEDLPKFWDISKDSYGRDRKILLLPEREACLMAMSYSYELQAYVFDAWQELKNAKPSWMIQLSPEAQIALNDLSNQLEHKTKKVEQLESLFHSGGTIAQFVKQLNGVNSQRVNTWLNENTNWLYDENKGKTDKYGRPKSYAWRCASYARDKYATESPVGINKQGMSPFTKHEVRLLADGKKWLFDKYIKGKLPMKADWNGEFTHKKDLV